MYKASFVGLLILQDTWANKVGDVKNMGGMGAEVLVVGGETRPRGADFAVFFGVMVAHPRLYVLPSLPTATCQQLRLHCTQPA